MPLRSPGSLATPVMLLPVLEVRPNEHDFITNSPTDWSADKEDLAAAIEAEMKAGRERIFQQAPLRTSRMKLATNGCACAWKPQGAFAVRR
jgi:hypothetical protein